MDVIGKAFIVILAANLYVDHAESSNENLEAAFLNLQKNFDEYKSRYVLLDNFNERLKYIIFVFLGKWNAADLG